MKRGIFFSIMALLLSALIILIFSSLLSESFDREALIAASEAQYVNDMVDDLETYVGAQLQISSFLVLSALTESYVAEDIFTGPSAQEEFVLCVRNGTFSPARISNICDDNNVGVEDLLEGSDGVFAKLEEAYPSVELAANVIEVNVSQIAPYTLRVGLEIEVNATYQQTVWRRYLTVTENVLLIGVEDPARAGTPYRSAITIRPTEGVLVVPGAQVLAGSFKNNFDNIAEFASNGYVYQDTSAPSFFAVLNGTLPSTIGEGFDAFGYASIIPAQNETGASLYADNQTSFLSHLRISPISFPPVELVRLNDTGINTNQTFPREYIENIYNTSDTDARIFEVAGCCTDAGCNPSCS